LYRQATITVDYGFAGAWDFDVGGLVGAIGVVIAF
jgi:hypothetical protein